MGRTISRLTSIVGSALMLFAVVIAALPAAQVSAAAGNPSYCDAQVPRLTNKNIGTEVPVIMVHGLDGHASDWGSVSDNSSFAGRVNDIPGVAVAHLYDYDSRAWILNESTRPKLAKTIDCIAQLSLHNGGKGKVIVVGYSLGGLAARDVLDRQSDSSGGLDSISDEVGQVITIATPHTGTIRAYGPLTTAWISTVPHFHLGVPVHTIAGDIEKVYYNSAGQNVKREQTHNDTLVTTDSAHDMATYDASDGGGSKTITCEKRYQQVLGGLFNIPNPGKAPCEHEVMISNARNGVREDTIDAIKKYVASQSTPTPPAPGSKSLTVGPLTTTYNSDWRNAEYGASGPGQDAIADDTTNGADCTNCETTPPPTVYAFIQITNMDWCTGSMQSCIIGDYPVVSTAPSVTIGGKTPSYSARYEDGGYQSTSLVWCFETEKVCVQYRRSVDTPQLEPSAALLDVFSSATWANP